MTRLKLPVTAAGVMVAVMAAATPAFAQIDITGTWGNRVDEDRLERAPGPRLGDYTGVPINDEGRARVDAWEAGIQSLPERQCILYTTQYMVMGPQNLRIEADRDPISGRITTYRMTGTVDRPPHTIHVDDRPHPSQYAAHTPGGFTTARWEGNVLVAHTTHLTEGMVWRNGIPHSDLATMDEYYTRHGDVLTITMIVNDPVYFDAPFIRSASFVLDPNGRVLPEPCEPQVESPRPVGAVPHHLPGENPFLGEFAELYNLPLEAARGGAVTTMPEYRKTLEGRYTPPEICTVDCCSGRGLNCN